MGYPEEIRIRGKRYKFIKAYKHYGLYETEKGIKECFDLFDLNIRDEGKKADYNIGNRTYLRYCK